MSDTFEIRNPATRILDSRWFGAEAGRVGDARPNDNGQRRITVPNAQTRHVAAELTITAADIQVGGYATLWGSGSRPNVAHLNYQSIDVSNTTTVPLSNGAFEMYLSGDSHVIIDLVGLYS